MLPKFSSEVRSDPFPHTLDEHALSTASSDAILSWLETSAPWELKIAEFYQQYEFSFSNIELPKNIEKLFSRTSIDGLRKNIEKLFGIPLSSKVDITAHKLLRGQVIRIHNDFIPQQETHRVLIQLNRTWSEENGGILMLFAGREPESLSHAFLPLNNTAFAFEISPKSFHAVSTIQSGERYTLVFSFFKQL